MMMKWLYIVKLDPLHYEIRYQDQEYSVKMSSKSTLEELWDELEKLDMLSEVITFD